MYTKRLLKLADFLDTLPTKRFDFDQWANGPMNECDSVGCALGWSTTIPTFKKLGFKLVEYNLGGILTPEYKNETGPYAAAKLFGITNNEAYHLFVPYENLISFGTGKVIRKGLTANATAKQVAKHIRSFIEWKRAQNSH